MHSSTIRKIALAFSLGFKLIIAFGACGPISLFLMLVGIMGVAAIICVVGLNDVVELLRNHFRRNISLKMEDWKTSGFIL